MREGRYPDAERLKQHARRCDDVVVEMEQVVAEAHLPAHYIKMIETDNYGMIADQLYLVPFLRRYATFLGLDAEDVASRFVSQVQHTESTAVRISQPLTMVANW